MKKTVCLLLTLCLLGTCAWALAEWSKGTHPALGQGDLGGVRAALIDYALKNGLDPVEYADLVIQKGAVEGPATATKPTAPTLQELFDALVRKCYDLLIELEVDNLPSFTEYLQEAYNFVEEEHYGDWQAAYDQLSEAYERVKNHPDEI